MHEPNIEPHVANAPFKIDYPQLLETRPTISSLYRRGLGQKGIHGKAICRVLRKNVRKPRLFDIDVASVAKIRNGEEYGSVDVRVEYECQGREKFLLPSRGNPDSREVSYFLERLGSLRIAVPLRQFPPIENGET